MEPITMRRCKICVHKFHPCASHEPRVACVTRSISDDPRKWLYNPESCAICAPAFEAVKQGDIEAEKNLIQWFRMLRIHRTRRHKAYNMTMAEAYDFWVSY